MQRPLELPVDLSQVWPAPILRRFRLGYSEGSATAVYAFTAPRRVTLQVQRRSSDRLVVHVDVALLEAESRRRLAPLSAAADGRSELLELPAGRYLIVAALLIPETVELELEIAIAPVQTVLRGAGSGSGDGQAVMERPLAQGQSGGGSTSLGQRADPLLQGRGSGAGSGQLAGTELDAISGRLGASGGGLGGGESTLRDFRWIDGRGRAAGALITIRPALWDRALTDGLGDVLLVRLTDQGGSALDLTGLEVTLELWDLHRFWRYALYTSVVSDPASGVAELSWDGTVAARPAQEYFSRSGNVLIGEGGDWLVSEADRNLALEDDRIHTLPEEICWDLRVRSVATGQTVYLLEGTLESRPRYTAIESVLIGEGDDWLISEDQQFIALESA